MAGPGAGLGAIVMVARIGDVPGELVLLAVLGAAVAGSVLAFLAPSERMLDWAAVPPPLARWRHRPARPPSSPEGGP